MLGEGMVTILTISLLITSLKDVIKIIYIFVQIRCKSMTISSTIAPYSFFYSLPKYKIYYIPPIRRCYRLKFCDASKVNTPNCLVDHFTKHNMARL